MRERLKPYVAWFVVGVLLTFTLAALPSLGLFVVPFALISMVLIAVGTKGRGLLGFPVGVLALIGVLRTVAMVAA